MPTKTESIKLILEAKTLSDLAALYSPNMECQVNVAQDGGTRVEGEFSGKRWVAWTDNSQQWKSFRIPHKANSTPEYTDTKITFDLGLHAEGIGMTGWDWENRLSRWVAFDFDLISGHSERHQAKMSEAQMKEVVEKASQLEWVTVRKSASGKGIHLYVFMEPVTTQNHNEHAALARAILGQMSALIGFDFNAKVDICGQNMWIWHRKMAGTDGLSLIKQGEILKADLVPANWRDHLKVITGHRRKTLPKFLAVTDDVTSEAERSFAELSGQQTRVPLDDEHKRLIEYLESHKTFSWWDPDHWMLVTHTFHLKEAHRDLHLRGIFETLATGSEAGFDKNVYCFPLRNGAWTIRRYSMGCQEAPTWDQDGRGWTRCFYNLDPDIRTAARSLNAIEDSDGSFVFNEAELAIQAAKVLGASIPEIPASLKNKQAKVKTHKDGRLIVEITGDPSGMAASDMAGWLHKKDRWIRIFNVQPNIGVENETPGFDDTIRHLISNDGQDYGWAIRGTDATDWRDEPLPHVRVALEHMGFSAREIKNILGAGVLKAWRLVNQPFQPEYPGNRNWNRGAAQFRFVPNPETEGLCYTHWRGILDHVGQNLTEALKNHPWALANGISNGGDYLKLWIASALKEPAQPLPYLFFYGEQNTGKSIFHEALSLLITTGYQRADNALINQSAFNEELKNAVICVIEEINLKREKSALNRLKDWVTALRIPIHPKGRTPYDIPNTTHWIQAANDPAFVPIFHGDSRITMIRVDALAPESRIPKKHLISILEREAPDFLSELLHLEIPPSNDRLNLPVIETAEKQETARMNKTSLQVFLDSHCFEVSGKWIKLSEFWDKFILFLDPDEAQLWTKTKLGRELPPHFPKGRNPKDAQFYIGNISFSPFTNGDPILPKYKAHTDSRGTTFLLVDNKSVL